MINAKISLIYFFSWCLAAWFFCNWTPAIAIATEKRAPEILDYSVEIQIKTDGQAQVAEKITLHGRSESNEDRLLLPARYVRRGWLFKKQLSDLSITDATGKKLPWRTAKINGQKIAVITNSPTDQETRAYTITYTLKNFFIMTNSGAHLDWPAIQAGWPFDILQAKITISLPEPSDPNQMSFVCQTNADQPKNCLSTRLNYTAPSQSDKIIFAHDRLPAGSGLNISLTLPSDQLAPSSRHSAVYIAILLLIGTVTLILIKRREQNKNIGQTNQ